jgi:hypothetical protein
MTLKTVLNLALLTLGASALPHLSARDGGTSVVNFANNTGTPQYLASGILYGLPEAEKQIPQHFLTDIKLQQYRGSGAQLARPSRGWIFGKSEYEVSTRQSIP